MTQLLNLAVLNINTIHHSKLRRLDAMLSDFLQLLVKGFFSYLQNILKSKPLFI